MSSSKSRGPGGPQRPGSTGGSNTGGDARNGQGKPDPKATDRPQPKPDTAPPRTSPASTTSGPGAVSPSPSAPSGPKESPASAGDKPTTAGGPASRETAPLAGAPLQPKSGTGAGAQDGQPRATAAGPEAGKQGASGGSAGVGPSGGGGERTGSPTRTAAAPTTREASAPTEASRSGGGLVAGVVGGVVGIALAGAGVTYAPEDLKLRLLGLEPVQEQVSSLSARVEELGAAGTGAAPTDVSATLDQVTARVAELEAASQGGGAGGAPAEELTALTERVAALESAPAPAPADEAAPAAPGGGGQDAAAEERLTGLERELGELRTQVQSLTSSGDEARTELEGRFTALAGQNAQAVQRTAAALAAVQGQVGALDQRLTGTGQRVEEQLTGLNQRVDERLGALGQRLDQIDTRRERAVTLALASASIGDAIAAEAPFAGALESVRSLGSDDPAVADAIARLEPVAQEGVPPMEALRQQFAQAAEAARSAVGQGEGDWAGYAQRQLSQLVRVQDQDASAEDGPSALLGAAQARLEGGDLAGAVDTVRQLGGEPAAAMQPWLQQAQARLDANRAAADLRERASGLLEQSS